MSFPVGIGIVTYNRKEILSDTIDRVRAFTRQPDAALVVADDGSSDGTLAMLRDKQVPVITGVNMGIAWNKNRALFLLSHMLGCETVILLEDDTQPTAAGWEAEWIDGQPALGPRQLRRRLDAGSISNPAPAPPPIRFVPACNRPVFGLFREALTYGGYFDPRFKGYGHEHVEHTRRLVRVGYGGTDEHGRWSRSVCATTCSRAI